MLNRNLDNYAILRLAKRYSVLTQKERENLLYLADIIDSSFAGTDVNGLKKQRKENWA